MFRKMREYTHEDFVELVENLSEEEIFDLSSNYGGYPVLYRMSLDERLKHIPFIQPGAAVIVRNENKEILLQRRSDNGLWGLPGGCQDLGEDLRDTAVRELYEETGIIVGVNELVLIDIVSGKSRKVVYPNGDITYNNTCLYLVDVNSKSINLSKNSESIKLQFFGRNKLPSSHSMHDADLIEAYFKDEGKRK